MIGQPRTLVTGGTGFVGRFIVDHLVAAGHNVTVFGRKAPAPCLFSAPINFVAGDLEPDHDFTLAVRRTDCLVHAAFDHIPGRYRGGEGEDPDGFWRRNVGGSLALFEAAAAAGVPRIVFLSSRAVYGPRPAGTVLDETMVPQPDTLYGKAKLAAERGLAEIATRHGICGVSLRVTGVYGPAAAGRPHKWTALFTDYLAGRPISPRAGTEVHGSDVAAAVRLMLEEAPAAVAGGVFNVSDLVIDRRAILAPLQAVSGTTAPLPEAADSATINAMTCDRLAALGWCPGGQALFDREICRLAQDYLRNAPAEDVRPTGRPFDP